MPDSGLVLQPGEVIRDVYRVEQRLGGGAHGEVYRVRHRYLGVQALKLLRPHPGDDHDRVLIEARILAGLSHPHVVRVFDAGLLDLPEGLAPYLAMEYLPLGTLADLLDQRIRFGVADALTVAEQILAGVGTAHALHPPVLHRDLIPANILVAGHEPLRVKVGDFGQAEWVHPVTALARAAGVITYLPPEADWGYATVLGDLYAVALVLYEMLTGTSAFPIPRTDQDMRLSEVQRIVLEPRRRPPPPPSRFRSGLDPVVDGLLVKALAPDPSHRFASAEEFGAAVRGVLSVAFPN